jgi:putative membrane protein insertion efficiency factor
MRYRGRRRQAAPSRGVEAISRASIWYLPRKPQDQQSRRVVAMAPIRRQMIFCHLGVTERVNVATLFVHRTFAAPPRKPLIFLRLWHKYSRGWVPCPGTAQIRAQDSSKKPMKHSSSPYCADCANAAARLPRNAGRALIWIYRHTLSPLVGFNCRHLPTCSVYGDEAIERFGLWGGGWMTLARLLRCHPWGTSGIDNVPLTRPAGARWYLPWRFGRWRGVNTP